MYFAIILPLKPLVFIQRLHFVLFILIVSSFIPSTTPWPTKWEKGHSDIRFIIKVTELKNRKKWQISCPLKKQK